MTARLETLITRALLDMLSDAIVARLRLRRRSALVLVSGTELGLRPALGSLARLCATGWRLEIRRTADASGLIGEETLRELAGGAKAPTAGDAALAPREIETCLQRNALVIVPTLSRPLAARLALGLSDGAVPGLLAGALERGVRIVAARDGCCPASRERLARGWNKSAAAEAQAAQHLGQLETLGVELVWASQLDGAVAGGAALAPVPPDPATAAPEPRGGGVFGWADAKAFEDEEVRLQRGVLVTPLAAEELRARHVRLVRV